MKPKSNETERIIETSTFRDDCETHSFQKQEVADVKTILALNPECGRKISFVTNQDVRLKCSDLRVLEWPYTRRGILSKAHILYVYIGKGLPIFLLRLDIDDVRGRGGPFNQPQCWPHWAEILGELTEIILRHVV